jgi:hypothetical protein
LRSTDLFAFSAAVWIALGVALWIFHARRAYSRRKRWQVALVAGAGLVFIAFAYALSRSAEVLYLAAPAVAAISILGYKLTLTCPRCGFTVHRSGLFSRAVYCPRCGCKLEDDGRP